MKTTPGLPAGDRGAVILVWCTWAIMALAALIFVGRYASNAPWYDEWDVVVPYLVGHTPVTAQWLWEFLGESRWPLGKLTYIGLFHVCGGDFRPAKWFNTVALVVVAAALIRVARSVRGRTSYADVFFPLALLHWGHYQNMLWSMQVVYLVPILLEVTLLLLILQRGTALTMRDTILAGLCCLLMPLCGGWGLIFAFPLALWIGLGGLVRLWTGGRRHRGGSFMLVVAAAVVALIGLYFHGYSNPGSISTRPPDVDAFRDTALQYLAMNFGVSGVSWWPVSGVGVLGLLVLTVLLLGITVLYRPSPERFRALGLLFFMAAVTGHTLGVGWGRSAWGSMSGFVPRYTTLAVLGLCSSYFAWLLYGPGRARSAVQGGLALLMLLALSQNTAEGLKEASTHAVHMAKFEADLRAREPMFRLVARYAPRLVWLGHEDFLRERMNMLWMAKVGPFAQLQSDPKFDEVPVRVRPGGYRGMTWDPVTSVAQVTEFESFIDFAIPEPTYVCGVQFKIAYQFEGAAGVTHTLRVKWLQNGQTQFAKQRSFSLPGQGFSIKGISPEGRSECYVQTQLGEKGEELVVTVWVDGVIAGLRLCPDDLSPRGREYVPDWVLEQLGFLAPARLEQLTSPGELAGHLEPYAFRLAGVSLLVPVDPERASQRSNFLKKKLGF